MRIKQKKLLQKSNTKFSMKLTDREKAMLVLDKRICWNRSEFDDVVQLSECERELKCCCIKHYIQTKSYERENECKNDNNEQSSERTEMDEDDDSDQEIDVDGRCSFHRTVIDEVILEKKKCSRK